MQRLPALLYMRRSCWRTWARSWGRIPRWAIRRLAKYARWANIGEATPYSLRHTFATCYLEANPDDLRSLASILGHAGLNTVMIYAEPSEEDLLKRMEKVACCPSVAFLGPPAQLIRERLPCRLDFGHF